VYLLAAVEQESAGEGFETMSHDVTDCDVDDFVGMSSMSVKLSSSLGNQTDKNLISGLAHTVILSLSKYEGHFQTA